MSGITLRHTFQIIYCLTFNFYFFFKKKKNNQNPKDYLISDDCFPNKDQIDSSNNKMNDNYEEKILHKAEDELSNNNSKNMGGEEEISASPKNKSDFKKKLALQIIPKKGKSSSATLKNYPVIPKKPSDETLAIDEEDDNSHHDDNIFGKKETILGSILKSNSETDIKRMKKRIKGLNLKLEISKYLKKKKSLQPCTDDLVGIKKEKKYYYFREKIVEECEDFFIKGKKRKVGLHDDMKVKTHISVSAGLKCLRKFKDDLDFFKVSVHFIQHP